MIQVTDFQEYPRPAEWQKLLFLQVDVDVKVFESEEIIELFSLEGPGL